MLFRSSIDIDFGQRFLTNRRMAISDVQGNLANNNYPLLPFFQHWIIHISAKDLKKAAFENALEEQWSEMLKFATEKTCLHIFIRDSDYQNLSSNFVEDIAELKGIFTVLSKLEANLKKSKLKSIKVFAFGNLSAKETSTEISSVIRRKILQSVQQSVDENDCTVSKDSFLKIVIQWYSDEKTYRWFLKLHHDVTELLEILKIHKDDFYDPNLLPASTVFAELRMCRNVFANVESLTELQDLEEKRVKLLAKLKTIK
eukprot:Awhi_evm1s522